MINNQKDKKKVLQERVFEYCQHEADIRLLEISIEYHQKCMDVLSKVIENLE